MKYVQALRWAFLNVHSFTYYYSFSILGLTFFLCADTEKLQQLQYPFTRKVIQDRLQDIQDGNLYQELIQPEGFLTVPENTRLTLCSDGNQL